jgi:hypothetical protein
MMRSSRWSPLRPMNYAFDLLELVDVFGEDGVRSYLVGYLEGVDDSTEEEDE